ncbi:sigma-70 family RNA polymerase sigma factor [Microbacterium sp. No. 7]|uniref:sigma-70 family RNA polymerase sigma factor n=1 Tax=Microbacterium sp. No. 7 TaxID=1714373 RepID=UPI0006CF6C63|nr:sigma-70 family RNA polymerase sigma factor [Microbacterium sp. No. 7]ALJ20323.1 hypothetical protein AOA12_10530 [Microbacterium sp. No. 7]
MTADPALVDRMIAQFHGTLVRTVTIRWGWMARGGVLTTVDDLEQVACLALLDLADTWPTYVQEKGYPADPVEAHGLTWTLLVERARWHIHAYARDVERYEQRALSRSLDADLDQYREEGTLAPAVRTAISVRDTDPTLQTTIADYVIAQPPGDYTVLALRYYDELSQQHAGDVLGLGAAAINRRTGLALADIRAYAHAQVSETTTPPRDRRGYPWTPPDTLRGYLNDTHGLTLDAWHARFAHALRSDVTYLCALLGPGRAVSRSTTNPRRKYTDEDVAEMTRRFHAGERLKDIAADYGGTAGGVWSALRRRTA